MKFGFRKPSLKKSIKARTTGKLKRKVKKVLVPFYRKKGTGTVKNPKKAVYNKFTIGHHLVYSVFLRGYLKNKL